jgi:hypothetical protein
MGDLNNRGSQDRSCISLAEAHEGGYWTEAIGVVFAELKRAVEKVGNRADAVRLELSK